MNAKPHISELDAKLERFGLLCKGLQMFYSPNCPDCKALKKLLAFYGITVKATDVSSSDGLAELMLSGFVATPVLKYNDYSDKFVNRSPIANKQWLASFMERCEAMRK